ncbi:MAG TPA: polyprenyl synthetase family protein, partial [Opitutaceae bacterium]
ADSETLGKTAGKDAAADKTTYVKLYGIEGAKRHAEKHTQAALEILEQLPGEKDFLRGLVEAMLRRGK